MRTHIRCNCGNRVVAKDVMQKGYYLRVAGPSFVWLKFRCSRCKRLGEQFIKQEEWDERLLLDVPCEVTESDKERFDRMGPIDIHEVIDVHFELQELTRLPDLHDTAKEK
ncbi:MAG: hypothetical protein IT209_06680 [Armatimonadetes bacterium]|nr:hypothetical protein [Armatimonadota bacterium]